MIVRNLSVVFTVLLMSVAPLRCYAQRRLPPVILPEERALHIPEPPHVPPYFIPQFDPPFTVDRVEGPDADVPLSLDEAIRITIANTDVVRLLSIAGSASAGVTIYSPAIASTAIDQQQARFDPTMQLNNVFRRFETPVAVPNALDPNQTDIVGTRIDDYDLAFNLAQENLYGGNSSLRVGANPRKFRTSDPPLNPESRSLVELAYTQPLLQGAGIPANQANILLARIDTDRSYFQLKDSVQESVRGVIQAYWDLVAARVDVFARQKQVEQAKVALEFTLARQQAGFGDVGDVAQSRLAQANFRTSLILAEANLFDREAALRAILGLPPAGDARIIPVTAPTEQSIQFDWSGVVALAEQNRPDIIELKLVLEADQQLLTLANNRALPRLDAVALYRWNGLEGETPAGNFIFTDPSQHTDWTLGVNFSVPLGLRSERAQLRRQELVIMNDRINLDQAIHNMLHVLAGNFRSLASTFNTYRAAQETRQAAELNLKVQSAEYKSNRIILLNVLQAIGNYGDALSGEARALASYNIALANLERQSGSILDTHGIRFYEERFGAIGPLGRLAHPVKYPAKVRPTQNQQRYPQGNEPLDRTYERSYEVPSLDVIEDDYRRSEGPAEGARPGNRPGNRPGAPAWPGDRGPAFPSELPPRQPLLEQPLLEQPSIEQPAAPSAPVGPPNSPGAAYGARNYPRTTSSAVAPWRRR